MFKKSQKLILIVLLCTNLLFICTAVYYSQKSAHDWKELEKVSLEKSNLQAKITDLEAHLSELKTKLINANMKNTNSSARDDLDKLNEILDLREKEIAELTAKLETQSKTDKDKKNVRKKRVDFEERMKKMKEEDPERYAKIQARIKEMNDKKKDFVSKRDAFFGKIDKNELTEEQASLLSDYQSLIQLNDTLMAERNRENMREVMENSRLMTEMQDSVRKMMLDQIGTGDYADDINDIYEYTNPMGAMGGGPQRGGGGDGGGGR
ncbi:MAG: hypothetical protein WCS73_06630 [Lentisphaeria bacterium]